MIPLELEFIKSNKTFTVKFLESKKVFCFHFKQISNKFSLTGEEIIDKEYIIYEDDYLRISDLINALKYDDILNPITKDLLISPFGVDNKHILFIKWTGWEQKQLLHKYPELEKIEKPELKELVVELVSLKDKINSFLDKIKKEQISVENFYRTIVNMIISSLSSVFPDKVWSLRTLLPTSFRIIQVRKFSEKQTQSINYKLIPFEARRLITFLEYFSKKL